MSERERRILIVVIAAGVALRVVHILTSLGSLDSLTWMMNIGTMEKAGGVVRAYLLDPGLNHPPLSLLVARLCALSGLEFQNAFRLVQTIADVITTLALARFAGLHAASFFMLSPAAIFISGFHCQSDPMMTMFVVLAAFARRPVVAGVLIACAAGIKIVALVALPLILLRFRGRELASYLGAAVLTFALIFAPAIAATGTVVLRNVFLYTGPGVSWGLKLLLRHVIRDHPFVRQLIPIALLASLAALWFVQIRKQWDTARVVGLAILLVLVLAPGFGVQYLFWPLPFLALLLKRHEALAMHGVLSVFLFAMYTAWSGGWPWWFGTERAGAQGVYWALGVWVALLIATLIAIRRLYSSSSSSPPALLYFLVLL